MKKEDEKELQSRSILASKNIRELNYVANDKGEYTTELSEGWEPKELALDFSIQEVEERVNEVKKKVVEGKCSPLVYYMELHKMDAGILASYVGSWKWIVKQHFKPTVFKKLTDKKMQKYASVFDITIEQLKSELK